MAFAEEMLFCKKLESTTTSKDMYMISKKLFRSQWYTNEKYCAADGAPNMMAKENNCLKLMKVVTDACNHYFKHIGANDATDVGTLL